MVQAVIMFQNTTSVSASFGQPYAEIIVPISRRGWFATKVTRDIA
jgi:hypothetical protein